MIDEDIRRAQRIVSIRDSNVKWKEGIAYHEYSFIYRMSNEKISEYQDFLKRRKRVLSVIASGNQIFNCIYEGCIDMTGFDISTFPKYYLLLQMGALESFNWNDFCKFLYDDGIQDEIFDEMYDGMRNNLNMEARKFWDSLLQFFEWSELRASSLFASDPVFIEDIKRENVYLRNEDNFIQLKDRIRKVNFSFLTGDIGVLVEKFSREYDFIYLSSIIYYKKVKEYKDILRKLPLTLGGEAFTYLYDNCPEIQKVMEMEGGSFWKFGDGNEGAMIYKRVKKARSRFD